jgi:RNA polymerase sigma-70 factor (ECF subfamily)
VIATDEELVLAARGGDSAAMNELLARHYDRVHAVCRRIAGASRDADDAAQETMIRIVRHLDKFDGRSSFGTWVYRIATNTSLDELRKRRRRPQLHIVGADNDAPHEVADPMADREVEASVDRSAIDAALTALPEDFRVPLVMRDVADLDYDEIAETLGIPVGTVKSRIARGRRQMVAHLENTGHFGNQPRTDRRPTNEAPDLP